MKEEEYVPEEDPEYLRWLKEDMPREMMKTVREEHFSKNLPICYMNDKKQIVYEYKDGRIEIIKQL